MDTRSLQYRNLSDFSDFDYDYNSSDSEYASRSRAPSRRASRSASQAQKPSYRSLDEDDEYSGRGATTAEHDPFADPGDYLGSIGGGTSRAHKEREECES